MIKLIKTTGEEIEFKWKEFTLDKAKEVMGDKDLYIERKRLGKTKNYMLMDEDGRMKNLKENKIATKIFNQYYPGDTIIVGNVIITDKMK
jgi:hypothetical protein